MTRRGENPIIRTSKKRIIQEIVIILIIIALGAEMAVSFSQQVAQVPPDVSTIRVQEDTARDQTNNSNPENENNTANGAKPLISEGLLGAIVGGIIGLFSGIIVQLVNNWIIRPRLSIDKKTTEYEFNYPAVPQPQEGWDVEQKFVGTRIKIENQGRTAAEECKASVIINKKEYRVAWTNPRQDFTVSINAHDSEYIDLCAIKEGATIRFLTNKRGYGESQKDGIRLPAGDIQAELKISARNAEKCSIDMSISTSPDANKKIIHFV
jgi:hypothetical protein